MNTQCPHCRTVFRLSSEVLEQAAGRVRCGHCERVFDAYTHLQQELPLGPAATPQPTVERLTATPPAPPDHAATDQGNAAPGGRDGPYQARLHLSHPTPPRISGILLSDLESEPAARRSPPTRRSRIGWGLVSLLLLLTLCGQVLLAQREALAQDPTLRPLLAELCAFADCSLAPQRALDRIELVRRNVYAHPNVDNALIIDARFVNTATFPQPYPILTVSLGNLRGKALIRRNFRPREYRPELDPNARLAPGSPVRITLEVQDPGREARTFELDFS